MITHYHILNISPQASDEEARRAYHALALRWHPDRNPGDPRAQQRFAQINKSYVMIKTRPQRQAYNRYLISLRASKPAPRQSRALTLILNFFVIFWPFTLGTRVSHG